MTRVLLLRHGHTEALSGGWLCGWTDIGLTAEGELQAADLARRLAAVTLDAVYTSPLRRCRETAAAVLQGRDLAPRVLEAAIEVQFGEWTGQPMAALQEDPRWRHWNSARTRARIPGGETMWEVQRRMVNALEEIAAAHPQQTVAVVSHGDVIRGALLAYLGVSADSIHRLEVGPASVSALELHDDVVRVLCVNDTGARF